MICTLPSLYAGSGFATPDETVVEESSVVKFASPTAAAKAPMGLHSITDAGALMGRDISECTLKGCPPEAAGVSPAASAPSAVAAPASGGASGAGSEATSEPSTPEVTVSMSSKSELLSTFQAAAIEKALPPDQR